jgi:myo-inositol-1(or 4)-monophosphatase
MELSVKFKAILECIRKAGEIMLSAHNIDNKDTVQEKAGDAANMVTLYDVAVQEFLIREIKNIIPDATFIAEEKENESDMLASEHCFIIDPIDGTANFIHEYHHSCISVAMFSRGEAVFGAVYDPYLDELFSAVKGEGAYLNGKPMSVSERDMSHAILAFGTSPYDKSVLGESTFKLVQKLFYRCSDVRRCGSAALDIVYLAAGRNDMFFELALYPWDIAAAQLIVKEAGGIITDKHGNELDFSRRNPVIAANKRLYPLLLEAIKEI